MVIRYPPCSVIVFWLFGFLYTAFLYTKQTPIIRTQLYAFLSLHYNLGSIEDITTWYAEHGKIISSIGLFLEDFVMATGLLLFVFLH